MTESLANKRLRAGVVGLGWAGQQHMDSYAQSENVDLVAIAGMETHLQESLGAKYGVEGSYSDWQAMIAEADLDVVSVCTPTSLHGPITIGALKAGVHVLSEKPMADNAQVAADMVAAAEASDRVLDVAFNHRRRGDVAALRSVIDKGILGSIYYAKTGWLRRSGIPGLGSWFTKSATAGGGPMMDLGVHMLDLALHLLDNPAVTAVSGSTYAEFGPKGRGGAAGQASDKWNPDGGSDFEVEDLGTAFLRLDGGGTLLLEASWASWIPEDQVYVTLYGTEGGAHLQWGTESPDVLKVWTEVNGVPAELSPQVGEGTGHFGCVQDFLAKVRSADYSQYRGRDSLIRAQVVDACYASADKGSEIALGL